MNFNRMTFPRLLMLAALLIGLLPHLEFAQSVTQTVPAYQSKSGMTVATSPLCIDLTQQAFNDHTFIYSTTLTTSAVLVTVTGSTNTNSFSTVTTGSTTTGATINFTGVYTNLCFAVTTLTGSGASVNVAYVGLLAGASGPISNVNLAQVAGATVNTGNGTASGSQRVAIASDSTPFTVASSPNPAFVTSYAGTAGMTTITSGSTTSFSSTTTEVTDAYCTNITSSAVVINLTDGAGNYFLKNFSLAANSALPAGWAYNTIWTTGIKASANTANAVNCQFNGFQ